MARKSDDPASRSRAPRRKTATATEKTGAGPAVESSGDPAPESNAAKRLVRAGIKALGEVHGDVLARQSRIFEVLLGIGQSPGWPPEKDRKSETPDPFGKFEHVFDERVARSLQRLGMPSPQALSELAERVEQLTEALRKLESPRKR